MASARSRCSSSCSARSSEPPNDGAACASRSSNSDRSPLSEKNSTMNITLQSRRWPGQPSPEFPANPSLDPADRRQTGAYARAAHGIEGKATMQGLVDFASQVGEALAILIPTFCYLAALACFLFAAW